MRFTKAFTAGAVAISMASTPVLAQPSAAPLSVAGSVERSGATIDGHSGALRGSNLYVSAAVVLALILAAILIPELTKPNSP